MSALHRAFTLLELLTVVAIMGLLAVASVGGYSAMQRGMRERSAVAAASGILRAAKERAAIDRVPTAVFCYNVLLRAKDADADESALVVGVMTAVRRAGRLTMVKGKYLYDEFGDLEKTYTALSNNPNLNRPKTTRTYSENDLTTRNMIRLYKFPTSETMEYSLVSDAVWCTDRNEVQFFSGTAQGGKTNCLMSAFYKRTGSKREPNWAAGDAYAFQIGEIQLPFNMTFGQSVPKTIGEISTPQIFLFDPSDDSDESIDVYTLVPTAGGGNRFQKAGRATSDEDEHM